MENFRLTFLLAKRTFRPKKDRSTDEPGHSGSSRYLPIRLFGGFK